MMQNSNQTNMLIDWLTFTVEKPIGLSHQPAYAVNDDMRYAIAKAFGDRFQRLEKILDGGNSTKGRPPYNVGWNFEGGLIATRNTADNVLVEFSGRGCEALRQAGLLDWTIKAFKDRLTRLDFAVDIQTTTTPLQIKSDGVSKRFKAMSEVISKTGETVYVGGMKSERYLRVYKYNKPHPRSDFLRFEFVYRKKYARLVAEQLQGSPLDLKPLMAYSGQSFGIEHDCWNVNAEPIEIVLTSPNKQKAGTLLWLTGVAAPAFRKLVAQKIITDPEKFIKEHFLCETD